MNKLFLLIVSFTSVTCATTTTCAAAQKSPQLTHQLLSTVEKGTVNKQRTTPTNKQSQATWQLLNAIENDDLRMAAQAIDNGADINMEDRNGKTPLHFAVIKGKLEMVQLLLLSGAENSVNISDDSECTPLSYASDNNNLMVAEMLLLFGARNSVNILDFRGCTNLYFAVKNDNLEMVQLLLRFGAQDSINISNRIGELPIDRGVKNKNPRMVLLLLQHGAKIPDRLKNHPVIQQAREIQEEMNIKARDAKLSWIFEGKNRYKNVFEYWKPRKRIAAFFGADPIKAEWWESPERRAERSADEAEAAQAKQQSK